MCDNDGRSVGPLIGRVVCVTMKDVLRCSDWTSGVCDNDGRSVGAQLGLVLQRLRAGVFLTLARGSWTFFR